MDNLSQLFVENYIVIWKDVKDRKEAGDGSLKSKKKIKKNKNSKSLYYEPVQMLFHWSQTQVPLRTGREQARAGEWERGVLLRLQVQIGLKLATLRRWNGRLQDGRRFEAMWRRRSRSVEWWRLCRVEDVTTDRKRSTVELILPVQNAEVVGTVVYGKSLCLEGLVLKNISFCQMG